MKNYENTSITRINDMVNYIPFQDIAEHPANRTEYDIVLRYLHELLRSNPAQIDRHGRVWDILQELFNPVNTKVGRGSQVTPINSGQTNTFFRIH